MTCRECGWTGLTARSRVRLAVFALSSAMVVVMLGLELAGLTRLGDAVWAIAITIMLASIGLRLVIRGDRCAACGGPADYSR